MKNLFQCVSSFLLPSSDLFCRWFKSASKVGRKVDKKTDRSHSDAVWLKGVFHLQSTLTINYRIYFHSSHFCRIPTFEFPSRGEYVTYKKKKYDKQWMCSTQRGGKGVEPSGAVSFLASSQVKDPSFHHRVAIPVKGEVHPKGDQSWVFIGRTDFEAETPILWPPEAKSWLIWKDPDAGKDSGQEEKGTTEDEMVGWHHWLNGHGFGWTPGVGDRQGGLACCNSWGRKESDTTERLNWTETNPLSYGLVAKKWAFIPTLAHEKWLFWRFRDSFLNVKRNPQKTLSSVSGDMLSRWYGGCWGHQITNPRTNPECWGSWRHHKHITNTPTWSKLLPFLFFCVGSSYSAVTKHLIRHGTSFLDSPFLSTLNAPFSPYFSWFWPLTGMDTLYLSPLTLLLYKKEKFHLMGEGGRKGSLSDWFQCGNETRVQTKKLTPWGDDHPASAPPLSIMLKVTSASQAQETLYKALP